MSIEELFQQFSDDVAVSIISAKDKNDRVDSCIIGQIRISLVALRIIECWNFDGILHIVV